LSLWYVRTSVICARAPVAAARKEIDTSARQTTTHILALVGSNLWTWLLRFMTQ
jgi:hypothetical protein